MNETISMLKLTLIIMNGKKTIDDVPERLRAEVRRILEGDA